MEIKEGNRVILKNGANGIVAIVNNNNTYRMKLSERFEGKSEGYYYLFNTAEVCHVEKTI